MITNRYSYIDLLRFIAAFTVAISHLFINKVGINVNLEIISSMAVEVFFIISGFVLAPQIIKLTEKKKFKEYRIFIIRRWYRTIPLYVLSLILTSIILNKLFTLDYLKYLFFIQNFFINWLENDYFSISWSLSVEEWFYILFPIYLILFLKIKEFSLIYISLTFVIIIFILRILFSDNQEWGENVRRIVIFRLDSIVFGFILFFLKDKIKKNNLNLCIIFVTILILSVLIFVILKLNINDGENLSKFVYHYIIAIWGSLIVLFFYISEKNINSLNLINLNLFLGKISYSIYLFHLLLIYIISSLKVNYFTLELFLFIVFQVLLSTLLYYYFEKPILSARPNYSEK